MNASEIRLVVLPERHFFSNCSLERLKMISISYWRHLKGIMIYQKCTQIVLKFKVKVQKVAIWTTIWIKKENPRRKVNSTETTNASTQDMQDVPVMIKGKKLLTV